MRSPPGSGISDRTRQSQTRANRGEFYFWKADTRPLAPDDRLQSSPEGPEPLSVPPTAGSLARWPNAIRRAAERALVALGDNPCWVEGAISLSRSFGEGLLARMIKDEARARTAFKRLALEQEKIVQAQPDYGPALCVLGLIDAALGRKDAALEKAGGPSSLPRVEKDSNNGAASFSISPLSQRGSAKRTLPCSNWNGARAPDASLMLSYGALKLLPSGTRSAAIRASKKSSPRSRRNDHGRRRHKRD